MIVTAVVVPAAPVLVPQVARGAASELDGCRAAMVEAVRGATGAPVDRVMVVGAGGVTRRHGASARGSLRGVGVGLSAEWGSPDGDDHSLPLGLTLAAWALSESGWAGPVSGLEVAIDEEPQVCLGLGAGLADEPEDVALVVAADGTARRSTQAPGYADDRSIPFDEQWIGALADADPATLARLDAGLATGLMMAGRAPLQVLAGAALAMDGAAWTPHLTWRGDPYGVAYAVAWWHRSEAAGAPG